MYTLIEAARTEIKTGSPMAQKMTKNVYCQSFILCGMRVCLNVLLLSMVGEQGLFLRV